MANSKKKGKKRKGGIISEISKNIQVGFQNRVKRIKPIKSKSKKKSKKKSSNIKKAKQQKKLPKSKMLTQPKKDKIKKDSFFTKSHRDLIPWKLRHRTHSAIMQMNNEERKKKREDIQEYHDLITKKKKETKDKNEKRRLTNEYYKTRYILGAFDYISDKYGAYDNTPRPHPKGKEINPEITDSIRDMQRDRREWGGGINLRMTSDKYPAKVVARQGNYGQSYADYNHDAQFHTHPTRDIHEFNFNPAVTNTEDNLKNLKGKVNSKKGKDKVDELVKRYRSPLDILPSKVDLNIVSDTPQATAMVVSEKGIMVLSNPNKQPGMTVKLNKNKQYVEEVIQLATVKSELDKPVRSVKEAEKRIEKYEKNIIDESQSFYNSLGIESDFIGSNEDRQPSVLLKANPERKKMRDELKEQGFWLGNINVKMQEDSKSSNKRKKHIKKK